jgi:hypothetical protein
LKAHFEEEESNKKKLKIKMPEQPELPFSVVIDKPDYNDPEFLLEM